MTEPILLVLSGEKNYFENFVSTNGHLRVEVVTKATSERNQAFFPKKGARSYSQSTKILMEKGKIGKWACFSQSTIWSLDGSGTVEAIVNSACAPQSFALWP
eukprot:g56566.t1